MTFTTITVTGGPFLRPDDTPAQGTCTATLSEGLRNGHQQVDPTPVQETLDAAGMLTMALVACNDVGTFPASPVPVYAFVLELDTAPIDPFTAVVPYNAPAGTVDLSALMP